MKKLLVISDTHGAIDKLRAVVERESPFDTLLFLGDGERDISALQREQPGLDIRRVRGNCDFNVDIPLEAMIVADKHLIFMTHGQMYGVKSGYARLIHAARNHGAEIALFGHTHMEMIRYQDNPLQPTLMNPGSLGYFGTYGILTCEDGGCTFEIREMD